MKRRLTFIILIVSIFFCTTFCVGAVQSFSCDGLGFTVPDSFRNDELWAQQQGYAYAFCDNDDKIEFNIVVSDNEGFTYSGMDEETLASYASDFEDSLALEGYTVESIRVAPYVISDIVEGVYFDIILLNGERNQFFWFATEDKCYQFDFYYEDVDYTGFVTEIMNSVVIAPSDFYDEGHTPSCGDVETTDEGYSDTHISQYDNLNNITKDTLYNDNTEQINKSDKNDGDILSDKRNPVIILTVCLGCAVIAGVIMFFKRKKSRKENLQPLNCSVQPVYFNNNAGQQGARYTPDNYNNQQYQNGYQGGSGYVENTGYAPDYDYSNKLDITLNSTDDFSKTEYRLATLNMDKKFTHDEEDL